MAQVKQEIGKQGWKPGPGHVCFVEHVIETQSNHVLCKHKSFSQLPAVTVVRQERALRQRIQYKVNTGDRLRCVRFDALLPFQSMRLVGFREGLIRRLSGHVPGNYDGCGDFPSNPPDSETATGISILFFFFSFTTTTM
jgi:hypothetical protein